MGNFLSEPNTEKHSESGVADSESNLNLTYSAVSMQGWRRTMEDSLKVEVKLRQGESLFGVFDGHGGMEVAEFCSREIVDIFQSLSSYASKDYETALKECFIALDAYLESLEGKDKIVGISREIQEQQRAGAQGELAGGDASDETLRKIPQNVGSTACVVLVTQTEIYCANSGDSRAILGQGISTHDLSDDHKPENEDELIRIEAAGCDVTDGRVAGKLSLSRAIGDLAYKQNKNLTAEQQAITCVPDITRRDRNEQDSFVLIACDGIWDVLTSAEASQYIREVAEERKQDSQPHTLLEGMFDDIICEDIEDQNQVIGGSDNMSAILIEFKQSSKVLTATEKTAK